MRKIRVKIRGITNPDDAAATIAFERTRSDTIVTRK